MIRPVAFPFILYEDQFEQDEQRHFPGIGRGSWYPVVSLDAVSGEAGSAARGKIPADRYSVVEVNSQWIEPDLRVDSISFRQSSSSHSADLSV